MNAEEFLTKFKRRGFQVYLVDGGLRVDPFPKLTPAERASIAEIVRDKAAKSTLERRLREHAANSGTPAKPATAATPAAKLSPADALLIREAQRRFPGSPLVGLGRPVPRRRKDRTQPDLTFEVIRSDAVQPPADQPPLPADDPPTASTSEVIEPSNQNEAIISRSDASTEEATPLSAELVANEKISLEPEVIANGEPEPEAPADSTDNREQS